MQSSPVWPAVQLGQPNAGSEDLCAVCGAWTARVPVLPLHRTTNFA